MSVAHLLPVFLYKLVQSFIIFIIDACKLLLNFILHTLDFLGGAVIKVAVLKLALIHSVNNKSEGDIGCNYVAASFANDDVATLCHDFYYKAHPELTYEERTKLNYDHPDAFDTWLMVEHIKALKEGRSVDCPIYSFVEHNRTDETTKVEPSKVIIVDGILIFENKELRDLMDIKVFVDTDADLRLARRILRDVCERGRTMQSVIEQYTTTVKPMHEEFIEPTKRFADLIIPEGGNNHEAIKILETHIHHKLK